MDIALTFIVAVGLSMDALAVAIACAASGGHRGCDGLKLALSFGFFQFAMAAVGWLAGSTFRVFFSAIDHWAAFAILAYIGSMMMLSGMKNREIEKCAKTLTADRLFALSFATSIDAFAVGMGFAFLDTELLQNALVIGITTFAITLAGAKLGSRIGKKWESAAEILGGLVLIGIGLRILADHML